MADMFDGPGLAEASSAGSLIGAEDDSLYGLQHKFFRLYLVESCLRKWAYYVKSWVPYTPANANNRCYKEEYANAAESESGYHQGYDERFQRYRFVDFEGDRFTPRLCVAQRVSLGEALWVILVHDENDVETHRKFFFLKNNIF